MANKIMKMTEDCYNADMNLVGMRGQILGMQNAAELLSEQSGRLFTNHKDDSAKTLRSLASDLRKRAADISAARIPALLKEQEDAYASARRKGVR
jgi:hypothetical protein